MRKKILLGILLVLIVSFIAYCYLYKDHRDISTETATYLISVAELQQEFSTNDSLALAKYQDQTISITAQVTTVSPENKAIMLDSIVYASFNDGVPKDIVKGEKIIIKGRFLGYDELLEQFKIDQSSIIR